MLYLASDDSNEKYMKMKSILNFTWNSSKIHCLKKKKSAF